MVGGQGAVNQWVADGGQPQNQNWNIEKPEPTARLLDYLTTRLNDKLPMSDQYRRLIRASELVRWAYCRRAWWLQYVRGHEPANPEALARGREFHHRHRKRLSRAVLYRQLALLAGLAGVGVLLIAVALLLLNS